MEDGVPLSCVIILAVAFVLDVFFYGFGSAIQGIKTEDIEKRIADNPNDKRGKKILRIADNPWDYINTAQELFAILNYLIGLYCLREIALLFMHLISDAEVSFFKEHPIALGAVSMIPALIIVTFVLSVFVVIIPKKLAYVSPMRWAYATVNVVSFIMAILSPIRVSAMSLAGFILKLFGIDTVNPESDVTEEDIISMVSEGQEQGVLQASEADMISNIIELSEKEAGDIMTNRKGINAIDGTTPIKEAVDLMVAGNNSRYPLYLDNIDHIIGIVHIRDALRVISPDNEEEAVSGDEPIKNVKSIIRKAIYVPETKNIDTLLKSMQATKTQVVIVVDEYGQTSGLVSVEDILEEIVGEIVDEHDEEVEYIEENRKNEFIIEGQTPLEDLEKRFGIEFDTDEFETLNGFMISKLERIPHDDEAFDTDYEGYNFKVNSVENRMITSVIVTKIPSGAAS